MLLKKRVDYGFGGYQFPTVPRGPRSVRKRGRHKKLLEDSQLCPFELLAAVAGELLQENESSASSNAEEGKDKLEILRDGTKHEQFEEDKVSKLQCLDQGSCVESVFIPDSAARDQNSECIFKEIPLTPIATSSDISKGVINVKRELTNVGNFYNSEIHNGSNRQIKDDKKQSGELIAVDRCSLKDTTGECVNNNNALNNLNNSVQFPLYRDPIPSASFAKHMNNIMLGLVRDDDENYFGCSITKLKAFKPRPESRFGYRRIRKILTSKYWKVAPKWKDSDLNTYDRMKPFYRNRKSWYPRERCHRELPSKRRKLCNRSFVLARDQEASSKINRNSPEKGDNNSSVPFLHRASGPSASVKGFLKSRDANVKFRIKSFKVPELYIEVPETATVGALKRTVMEAVTAILEGGLRVGVVHKGKRVRDDKRTLQQAGISDTSNLEALGFALEPSLNQISPTESLKQPLALHPHDTDQLFTSSPAKPNLDLGLLISNTSSFGPVPATKMERPVEFSHELGPMNPADAFMDGAVQDSKALVMVPATNAEALDVVPINQKPRCSELTHRRIRRPFSVREVEALVEAVETLGTGRWRDVKVRAFDIADHRTYVDLKDKWKTLVHTATISPQQRRGEPVPQELLDRVLSAHGYWSQNQSKQHGKHHD